jgi:hypothetical protein
VLNSPNIELRNCGDIWNSSTIWSTLAWLNDDRYPKEAWSAGSL